MSLKLLAEYNEIRVKGKTMRLPELVQESYRLSYRAKRSGNEEFIELVEKHLQDVKKNPMDVKRLSENLEILLGLEELGESAVLDLDEVTITKAKPRRGPKDRKRSRIMKKMWRTNRKEIEKALKKFRKSAKGKAFYRALAKFNARLKDSKELTLKETIQLFKAGNSALTQLAIELEHNPDFKEAFDEVATILSENLQDLLESIINEETPEEELVESFCDFYEILSIDD